MNRYSSLFLAFTCSITINLFGQGPGTVYAQKKLKPKVEVTYAEKLGTIPPLSELIPVGATSTSKRNLAKKNRKGPKDFPGRGRNTIIRPELEHQGVDAIRQTSFNENLNTVVEPVVNINGLTSGFAPNDPTGDVGENHYLQAINATTLGVFDKAGNLLNTFTANTLWRELGFFSAGDPIILYDQQNNRWIITEFPNQNELLIAVSENSDPMSSYTVYNFPTPQFPDYPKYGIWDDYLTVSTNEGSPGTHSIYILDKAALMAGVDEVPIQRLELPGNTNTFAGFFVTTPLDWTGSNEPVDGPMFITLNDSAWGVSDEDQIEVYTINVDLTNSDNTTFDNTSVVLAPFDGFPCALANNFTFACVPQSGGGGLDAIPETIMNQAHYRNFISHESMVFNFITDVTDGQNLSGIRWVELRRVPGGEWSLHQEGTFAPDDGLDRFMGSICMDGAGNIGLAYNVTSANSFVGVRFTGRRASDPLGEMTVEEFTVAEGTNRISSDGRFGDYSHMTIDPVDDKTFWFTTEYANRDGGGDVNTRIIAFSIELDTIDIGPTALIAPQNSSDLTSSENITIQVTNFGLDTQSVFQVGYLFQNQAPVTEAINRVMLPGETYEHTFASTVDMSMTGSYDFELFTNLAGDENIPNDTLSRTVIHLFNRDISVAGIEGLDGENCGSSLPISIVLSNNGTDLLNSATFEIVLNDTLLTAINWTGSLEIGESESIPFDLTGFLDGSNQITITASAPNGTTDENPTNNAFSTEFTAILNGVPVILTLNLDEFPEETSWVLADAAGNTIAEDGPYPPFPLNPTIQEEFCLVSNTCYTFTIMDLENDGICCDFGFGDYNITDAQGNVLLASNGIFGSSETNQFCVDFTCTLTADADITPTSSADAQDGSILIIPENGSEPFQYSIDNGQTFQESPLFNNLLMGAYPILVVDNMGCTFENTVMLDIVSSTADIEGAQFFKAYPNPTDGIFNIEVSGLEHSSVFLNLEIYNTSGQLVQRSKIGKFDDVFKGQVSLYHYPVGTYLIRFSSENISRMMKVVRL